MSRLRSPQMSHPSVAQALYGLSSFTTMSYLTIQPGAMIHQHRECPIAGGNTVDHCCEVVQFDVCLRHRLYINVDNMKHLHQPPGDWLQFSQKSHLLHISGWDMDQTKKSKYKFFSHMVSVIRYFL